MKLLLFNDYRLGGLTGDRVVDITRAVPGTEALLAAGVDNAGAAELLMERVIDRYSTFEPAFKRLLAEGDGLPLASVQVLPPLPRPHNVLCAFANYGDRPGVGSPIDFFYKGTNTIVGDGATVEIPDIPEAVVFQPEPELAFVIGRRARNVSESEALSYVFGYCNFVDVSARGIPNRRTQFLNKSLDTWAPIGPFITTADEIADPQAITVRLGINGVQKQEYSTGAMTHSVAKQIEWLSSYITLVPGDIISCGVHHSGLQPINDGDRVDVEGEGLGRLHFSVKSEGPVKTEAWRPPGGLRWLMAAGCVHQATPAAMRCHDSFLRAGRSGMVSASTCSPGRTPLHHADAFDPERFVRLHEAAFNLAARIQDFTIYRRLYSEVATITELDGGGTLRQRTVEAALPAIPRTAVHSYSEIEGRGNVVSASYVAVGWPGGIRRGSATFTVDDEGRIADLHIEQVAPRADPVGAGLFAHNGTLAESFVS
ncbi:MAG: gentisate 1,2-dioxygenase [Chloroflexi bacterium]|nr:gentisate 1,2-dioxygenase [Chloroflexota bacterium]